MKHLIHVLHAIGGIDPRAGGTTAALVGMAKAQAAAGLSVRVLAPFAASAPPSTVAELQRANVVVCNSTINASRRTAECVAAAQIVHTHGLWEGVLHQAAVAARHAGRRLVVSPHGMLDRWSLSQKQLKKRLYWHWRLRRRLQWADRLHVTTPGELEGFGWWKPDSGKAWIIPLGLDPTEFEFVPATGMFRGAHPLLGERPLVLYLSRLHPKKGPELLIDALGQIRHRTFSLAMVGPAVSPEYLRELQARAAAQGLGDRTVWPGMLSGQSRLEAMRDAAVFALPSQQENFGIVVAESLACGTPVMISPHVNLSDWVKAEGVGEVVPLDVAAWAAALEKLLVDPARRAELARRTRESALREFNWPRLGHVWAERYASLLDGD